MKYFEFYLRLVLIGVPSTAVSENRNNVQITEDSYERRGDESLCIVRNFYHLK